MEAIKFEAPQMAACVKIQMPKRKAGEALIKIKSAGICGSDIGAFRGTNPLVSYPRIIGHEVAGEILEIEESNQRGLKPGDKVIVDPYLYCGQCYPCSIGRTNCCADLKVLGVHVDGGMAEYFTHPDDMLWKLPDDMPWELAPMAEPLTIALHGIHRGGLKSGEHVVIIGAGSIGLLAGMAALTYGAVPILVDLVEERLAIGKQLGITYTVNSAAENTEEKILNYTNGKKAELVMECSGANAAILSTLDLVANAGRITLTGWPKNETPIPTATITRKEVDIVGARNSANEFEEAIALISSRRVKAEALLTETVSLAEAPEIIRKIAQAPGDYLKVNVLIS